MAKKGNVVKKSKSSLQLLLIVLIVAGWLLTLTSLIIDEEADAQEELITKAQNYLEDKLYIRAIKNYETALQNYQTKDNFTYETELLGIYLEAEMMEEYYNLLSQRYENQTSLEEEYLILARYYVEEDEIDQALSVLNTGIELFENDEMIQLREKIRYELDETEVLIIDAIQPEENWIIPTYDGTKWGYMNQKGKMVLDFIYEEATPFCGDYAVVKLDGVYTLIDKEGYWNAVDKIGLDKVLDISASAIVGVKDGVCQIYTRTFQPATEESFEHVYLNDNGLYVVKKDSKWAILDEKLKPVTDYVFTDVAVNSQGSIFTGDYAVVKDENGYCHIDSRGNALYETRFVDAKGYEGGLIAVANKDGKWGFANGEGEMIVDYKYGDAYSFSSQLAAVEYGGEWGYINYYNQMVIEPIFVQAYPFINRYALVSTQTGSYKILTLEYFDSF